MDDVLSVRSEVLRVYTQVDFYLTLDRSEAAQRYGDTAKAWIERQLMIRDAVEVGATEVAHIERSRGVGRPEALAIAAVETLAAEFHELTSYAPAGIRFSISGT